MTLPDDAQDEIEEDLPAAIPYRWLSLGVVAGNTRVERFWLSCGFVETRIRTDYQIGQQLNTLRVMCKPFAVGSIKDYLMLVDRDVPGAPPKP